MPQRSRREFGRSRREDIKRVKESKRAPKQPPLIPPILRGFSKVLKFTKKLTKNHIFKFLRKNSYFHIKKDENYWEKVTFSKKWLHPWVGVGRWASYSNP